MARYRLTHAAQADIVSILAWLHEQFGQEARMRYEALIPAAIQNAATRSDEVGRSSRPELGEGRGVLLASGAKSHAYAQ